MLIGGLLGKYTFIGVFLSFCTIYAVLHIKQKRDARKSVTIESGLAEDVYDTIDEGPGEREVEGDFKFMSALTSIWLPSVVGSAKSNFFITASIVSLVNKLILLTVAVLLVSFTDIDTKPLLLWCQPNITTASTFQIEQHAAKCNASIMVEILDDTILSDMRKIHASMNQSQENMLKNYKVMIKYQAEGITDVDNTTIMPENLVRGYDNFIERYNATNEKNLWKQIPRTLL